MAQFHGKGIIKNKKDILKNRAPLIGKTKKEFRKKRKLSPAR